MWEFFCNDEATLWIAYNVENYTPHRLMDEGRGMFEPDPAIPQDVIEAWRVAKEAGYRSGFGTPKTGKAYIAEFRRLP